MVVIKEIKTKEKLTTDRKIKEPKKVCKKLFYTSSKNVKYVFIK